MVNFESVVIFRSPCEGSVMTDSETYVFTVPFSIFGATFICACKAMAIVSIRLTVISFFISTRV